MNGHVEKRVGKKGSRWHVVYYVDKAHGGPARKSGGTYATRREAQDALGVILAEYREGTYREASTMTVGQLLARWLKDSAEASVRPTSLDRYRSDVAIIEARIGDRMAAQMRTADCDSLLSELRRSGRRDGRPGGLSAKTVRCLRGTLSTAYHWAVRGGLLRTNPVADSAVPRVPGRTQAALELADVRRILTAAAGHALEPVVVLAAATGMRRAELLALRWSDIDLQEGTVTVARQVVYVCGAGTQLVPYTKGGKPRQIAVPAPAIALLRDVRQRQMTDAVVSGERWQQDRLLVARADGSPMNPNSAGSTFGALMHRSGLPGVHLHMLRHAFATEMIHRQGVDVVTVQRMLGHGDPATTMRMYVAPEFGQQVAAAERLADAWKAASGETGQQIDITRRHLKALSNGTHEETPA